LIDVDPEIGEIDVDTLKGVFTLFNTLIQAGV